ncbi:MAG: zinc ribbon domain-containing protein [Anaerolineae bacterium]|nr:zinc ribbon domain-containing protein [Anaerolineae bacterium]
MNTRCPKCGAQNRAGGRFCRNCGAPLQSAAQASITCPICNMPSRPGAHFCRHCGAALDPEHATVAGASAAPAMPPVPQLPASSAIPIQPRIGARPAGQIVVGNYNLLVQMGDVKDAVVNIMAPAAPAQPRPRATPAALRPRAVPNFLDRQVEVAAAASALLSANTVAFHGESGIGKTTLLCYLAHHPTANAFRDGVIYLYAARQNTEDIATTLYEALFTYEVAFHPTPAQVREGLQDRRALILLDDCALKREALETLLNLAPQCTFVITSEVRCYWGAGQAMELPGLPPADGAHLLERELGRALTAEERFTAQRLAAAVNGHPLQLLQLAALARSNQPTLSEMLPLFQAPTSERALISHNLASLSELERRILAVLAAVKAPLHEKPLALIVGQSDLHSPLQSLQSHGLVQQHSPRYSLTGDLAAQLALLWDLEPWRTRALEVLTGWAEGQQTTPEDLRAESDAIISSVEQALAVQQPREALQLIRASESALALAGGWGAWSQLLQHALTAARSLQDQSTEAWALHQMGTRAGCLGEKGAGILLSEALNLRQKLGDKNGAALTRHNMTIFLGVPPISEAPEEKPTDVAQPEASPSPKPRPRAVPTPLSWIAAVVILSFSIIIATQWQAITRPWETTLTVAYPALVARFWLADGCDRTYTADSSSTLHIESNLDGRGIITLDGNAYAERELSGETPIMLAVNFANIEAGTHSFEITVVNTQQTQKTAARCTFTVMPAETPPTPEPPVDDEGPPAPRLIAPKANEERFCPTGTPVIALGFDWSEVNDPSGIAYYEIRLQALEAQPRVLPFVRSEGSYVEVDLQCSENYSWRVRAFDEAGNAGTWSTEREFWLRQEQEPVVDDEAPPAPRLVAPQAYEEFYCPVGAEGITLGFSWDEVEDASGIADYEIALQAIEYQPETLPPVHSEGLYVEVDLRCPEIFRWRVRAFDSAGNAGAWSAEREFWLRQQEDVTPPPVPETISPGDPNPAYAESVNCPVTLRWNPVSDPSGVLYTVEVEIIYSSDNMLVLSRTDLDSTELILESSETCEAYEDYRWRVSARDGAGNASGEWSPWRYYSVYY